MRCLNMGFIVRILLNELCVCMALHMCLRKHGARQRAFWGLTVCRLMSICIEGSSIRKYVFR